MPTFPLAKEGREERQIPTKQEETVLGKTNRALLRLRGKQ